MKILLIAPYVNLNVDSNVDRDDFYPSAALLHLAAVLRSNNHEPIIVDLNNSVVHNQKKNYLNFCKRIITENLKLCNPDLVGINCLFSGVFPDVLEFAKTIKNYSPHLKIAVGGIHPTSYYKEILTHCKDVDYVAIGEGEKTILSLTRAIKNNDEALLSKIKSFAYRDKDGNVKFSLEKDFVDDLDSLPMPAWDLIDIKKFEMNLENYYNPKKLPLKFKAGLLASRACPLACNFCDMFLVMGKKHRKRSITRIVDEMEWLKKERGVNYFSFMDDQLTLNRAHVIELCNQIINRKLDIQFDTPNGIWINSIREEVIAKMAEAGLVSCSIAIEHGDEYIRNKIIGKNLEKEKIFEVAHLLKKYKVMSSAFFIMGFPEDTNETLSRTFEMMNELQLDRMAADTLVPFPGTKLFKQVINEKLLLNEWNLNELWKTPISKQQGDFVIKPYNMRLDDLYKWREKFDSIRYKYKVTNPKKSNNPYHYRSKSKQSGYAL